jgi:hypothetical protein
LKQKGEDLSGLYAGKFGESKITGTVKESAVEFELRVTEKDQIVTVHIPAWPQTTALKGRSPSATSVKALGRLQTGSAQ